MADIHDYLRDKELACKEPEGRVAPVSDPVNHPAHYTGSGGIECIDAIEACISSYNEVTHASLVWQVIKYLWRAPLKDNYAQDIRKAQFYLNRLVAKLDEH